MILLALVGAALACRCPDVPPEVVPADGATIAPDQAFTVLGFAEVADIQIFDDRGRPVPSHTEPAAAGAWIVRPDRKLRRGHSYRLVSWPLPGDMGDAHFGAWRYTVGAVEPSPPPPAPALTAGPWRDGYCFQQGAVLRVGGEPAPLYAIWFAAEDGPVDTQRRPDGLVPGAPTLLVGNYGCNTQWDPWAAPARVAIAAIGLDGARSPVVELDITE